MAQDVLLYAAPNTSADALWFGRFRAGDPLLAFTAKGKKHAAVVLLEVTRARREGVFDVVHDLQGLTAAERKRDPKAGVAEVIVRLAREHGVKQFTVPPDFPVAVFQKVVALGLPLKVGEAPFFPKRVVKTPEELDAIRASNRAAAAGFKAVEKILAAAEIRAGNFLWFEGKKLTAERLRAAIERATLDAGALNVAGLIAAPGDQAVDCHAEGAGPVRANELIVVDIFPRSASTGYYGDMTRTYLKGKASPAQRKLVKTVRDAQLLALSLIKPGIAGVKVHEAVQKFFEERGYKTARNAQNGFEEGFFHGLGHGLGLDVHEDPGLNTRGVKPLVAGNVVTVEPGLYYIGTGGCRIEDNVVVTDGGCELLSRHPYRWEIA